MSSRQLKKHGLFQRRSRDGRRTRRAQRREDIGRRYPAGQATDTSARNFLDLRGLQLGPYN
jgi:hypothetical protein